MPRYLLPIECPHLVLSREPDESIVIAIDGEVVCVVTNIEVRGRKVRMGFHAPRKVTIHRKEIWEAIERDKAAAAAAGGAT